MLFGVNGRRRAFDDLHFSGGHQLAHARHGGGRRTKFGAPMHQRQGAGLLAKRHRPVERRIAAAANHEVAAVKIGGILDPIMHALAFECLDARQSKTPRLKGAHSARDHHGTGEKAAARGRGHEKLAVRLRTHFRDFLSQVEGGVERLGLFEQPIHQFLGAADGQRGDIVYRLLRIQLGALPPDLGSESMMCALMPSRPSSKI
jgi:hypothetical protein